ncbi:MAG: carbohydrate kinase family protein [Candidatus Latescibacteria bacterium]|nr:carbohydrate kinase family protein [Candidatus Latescibacterota bacterium]
MRLVSVGESTIDLYSRHGRSFVGGISLNFAVHARRNGLDSVALISRVGSDVEADRVLNELSKQGVLTEFVAPVNGATATCVINVNDEGERSYPEGGYHRNILDKFELTPCELQFIGDQDVLVTMIDRSSPFRFVPLLLSSQFDNFRVADFGDWQDYCSNWSEITVYARFLDLLFISGNEQTIDYLAPFTEKYDGVIVVTLGAEGSAAVHRSLVSRQRAIPLPRIVDTTGCGDAFQAAFLVSYLTDRDVPMALLKGAECASEVASYLGSFRQE